MKPFIHQESRELGSVTLIETDKEFAAVRANPLQRVRQAGGEIPKVALFHVGDIRPAEFVENGDAAIAIGHVGPLGELVPVHLADAAGGQPHVDAGDGVRDRKFGLRHLARPAAVLNAPWRVVECRPRQRHAADVGWRRGKRRWKLAADGSVLRTRSTTLRGFVALIAPCGGSFGLPKAIGRFFPAPLLLRSWTPPWRHPPTAVAANTLRREIIAHSCFDTLIPEGVFSYCLFRTVES